MRRLLALLMMMTVTLVSGTSYAAAICHHQNAQAHAAALAGDDAGAALDAHVEEAAGAVSGQRALLIDLSTFSLPAFIIPALLAVPLPHTASTPRLPPDPDPARPGEHIPPLLQPPAA